jgi:hypothetical protein
MRNLKELLSMSEAIQINFIFCTIKMFYYNPVTKTNTYIPMSHSHTEHHTSTSTGSCLDEWGCNTCSAWWVVGWIIIFIAASIFMWAIIREAF